MAPATSLPMEFSGPGVSPFESAEMARMPFLPVLAGKRRFQPIYVRDLGQAIAIAAISSILGFAIIFVIGLISRLKRAEG